MAKRMTMERRFLVVFLCLALVLGLWPLTLQTTQADDGDVMTYETPEPSGGSYMLRQSSAGVTPGPYSGQDDIQLPSSPGIGTTFDGFNYDDNSIETGGWVFIPPDPIGAAGTDRLIAVVNAMIEARDKTGTLLWRDALADFFTTLTPANWLFDPKIVYDHYENRFLVVALERVHAGTNPNAGNTSRILLAVSKTATPATATAADWYYTAIDSKELIGGDDHWADYPGFEVDEEAVYITGHMFAHDGGVTNYSVRLWIVDKGVAAGFYAGGAAAVTKHDPYAGGGIAVTTMPAQVYGAGGIDNGGSGGTYLVSYSGITDGVDEAVQVVRVDDPLGTPTFVQEFVVAGNIENLAGDLPDAPQLGSTTDIEVNDRRALDAVWRNNRLWLTTTINPNAGPDAGQTTAHWFRLDTSAAPGGVITLDDQGDIGGEDIADGTYTYFPALAVNNNGDAKFGFSASAPTIYAGAYATVHLTGDPAGTVGPSETVRAGVDYYVRTFGGPDNRWGDYTGAALDPTDDNVVWLFNQYAMLRGSGTPPEDGRWGTVWASNLFTVAPTEPTVDSLHTRLLAVKNESFQTVGDLPNSAKIVIYGGEEIQWMETALIASGITSSAYTYVPPPEWLMALTTGVVDAVLVRQHPSVPLEEAISSGEVRLLPWSIQAVEAVTTAYPEETIPALLPPDTYGGQSESILGYAATSGLLRVETSPPVPTRIFLDGIPRNDWGLDWVKLPAGEYTLSFSDVPGYLAPISQPIEILPDTVTEVIASFIQLGNLWVETSPALPATIFANGNPMNDWGFWASLEEGGYTVSFQDMPGYVTPSEAVVTVNPGETTHVIGDYVPE